MKKIGIAYLLWFLGFFGWLGFHRFYLWKIGTGILWLFTFGCFGIGALVDLFTLGRQVRRYNAKKQMQGIDKPKTSARRKRKSNQQKNLNSGLFDILKIRTQEQRRKKSKLFEFSDTQGVYVMNDAELIDFVSSKSKAIGAINHLGVFADDVKITKEFGTRITADSVFVIRKEYNREQAGDKHSYKDDGIKNIFDDSFTPPEVVEQETEEKFYRIASTVKTYECATTMKCTSCGGQGYHRCSRCDGTGKEKQEGTYSNGASKIQFVQCGRCFGSGRITCSNCDGTRIETCTRCEGTGRYQKYKAYSDQYIPYTDVLNLTDKDYLIPVIAKAKGDTIFNDMLMEWKNQHTLCLDKRSIITDIHNKYIADVVSLLEKYTPPQDKRVARVKLQIELIPITIIDYTFESHPYQLSIVGDNNYIYFDKVPSKHHSYKQNIFQRAGNIFNSEKRKIGFAYIASFIFHSDDGQIGKEELQLLNIIVGAIKMSKEKQDALMNQLIKPLSIDKIKPYISCLRSDKRVIIFAWHCVIADGQIEKSEEQAFEQLVQYFKVQEKMLNELKNKATKFAKLTKEEMLNEYLK
ncbi:hypothetical protein AGMMS4956_15300 [Bacteroidia bacterium]|nr:hypothetical protein AGMMS4956_15300 [Bacteroidia bacterium]